MAKIKCTNYHITKKGNNWVCRKAKSTKSIISAPTKSVVLKEAAKIAKKQDKACMYVHGLDGKIQDERNYGKK